MELIFLRHASTSWNREKRYQGHTDTPLCEEGKLEAVRWRRRLPEPDLLFSSPLLRARQTAALLYPDREPFLVESLKEMGLGSWEGKRAGELLPEGEGSWDGLDFSPPGGESMRQVIQRLESWLETLPPGDQCALVVTHKMVITALYSLATGWDASSRPEERLRFPRAHRFCWDGSLKVVSLNEPLEDL